MADPGPGGQEPPSFTGLLERNLALYDRLRSRIFDASVVLDSVSDHVEPPVGDRLRVVREDLELSDRELRQAVAEESVFLREVEDSGRDLDDRWLAATAMVVNRLFGIGLSLAGVRSHLLASIRSQLPPTTEASDRLDETINELDATIRELRLSVFDLLTNDRPAAPEP